ncbi:MAG: LysM peptidoglycan-binding domain-containing protein [Desulfobacteria bacterium]
MKKALVLIALLWTFFLLPFYKGEAKDPNDHLNLFLTKTVSIKKYGNLKVYYEPYTVKEGEWLWKILVDKYKIPFDQRVNFLHVLKKLNPTIPNTNKVYPGQKIFIPLKLETSETGFASTSPQPPSVSVKEHTVQPGESLSTIFLHVYKVPGHLVFNEYTKLFHKLNPTIKDPNLLRVGQRILVPVYEPISKTPPFPSEAKDKAAPIEIEKTIPFRTESGTKGIKDFIGTVFKNTGDHYIDKGNYYIPIPGRGELTLNNETFPILEMKSGRKVIIDVGDQLPARIEKLIESNWKNYKILNIRKDEGTESIFNKLSPLSGYYSIIRGDKPLILKGKITIKVWADWIIFKDKESFIKNRGYAVNFIGKKDKEVPLAIKDYIERFGMRVIDISLTGKEEHRQDQKKGSISGEEEIIILNSSTNNELIHALLTLIDQPFTAGAKLPLLSKGNSGFQLGITADIFLKREVRDCIISLQKLPHDMVEILTENKFRILEVQKEETQESVISKVLDFLGIGFSFPTFEFDTAGKGDPHNIAIAIPGFLFQENDLSKILLTKANVDKNIASFLREKGIKAVRY